MQVTGTHKFNLVTALHIVYPRDSHLIRYSEAVSMLKSPQDSVWLASAYEGISTIEVLEAWAVIESMVETFTLSYLTRADSKWFLNYRTNLSRPSHLKTHGPTSQKGSH